MDQPGTSTWNVGWGFRCFVSPEDRCRRPQNTKERAFGEATAVAGSQTECSQCTAVHKSRLCAGVLLLSSVVYVAGACVVLYIGAAALSYLGTSVEIESRVAMRLAYTKSRLYVV